MARTKEQYVWILRNIRAQYNIPESIQDIKAMEEWMKRMRASKYMIQMMKEAYKETKRK